MTTAIPKEYAEKDTKKILKIHALRRQNASINTLYY
jgi:hypothetical protein